MGARDFPSRQSKEKKLKNVSLAIPAVLVGVVLIAVWAEDGGRVGSTFRGITAPGNKGIECYKLRLEKISKEEALGLGQFTWNFVSYFSKKNLEN